MLEAGDQQVVLEGSAAREEHKDQLPQALVSTGHPAAPTQQLLGHTGDPWSQCGHDSCQPYQRAWDSRTRLALPPLRPQAPHTTEGSSRAQQMHPTSPQSPLPQPWHPCCPTLGAGDMSPVPPPGERQWSGHRMMLRPSSGWDRQVRWTDPASPAPSPGYSQGLGKGLAFQCQGN